VCVKDKFVLDYAMKSYGGVTGVFHSFVTLPVGCERSSLRPGLSTPGAIDEEGRWASEAIWMVWKRNKSSVIPRIELRFLGRPGSSIVTTLYSRRKNTYVTFSGLLHWRWLGLRCPQKAGLIECPTLSRVALMFKWPLVWIYFQSNELMEN
jgi:hypothetical protein